MTRIWGRAVLAGAASWLTMGGAAVAQDAPSFPPSLDREPLLLWLQRETDILADRVVAVTPQALTSVVSAFPAAGDQGPRLVIRAEALSPDTYARTGALSWHVSVNADCKARRVKLGETTGYPQRNLLGERKLLRPAETDWRTPERGTALDSAWRAACEANFKGPFGAGTLKVAQETAAAAPSRTEPAPAKAAPPPVKPTPTPAPASAPSPQSGDVVAQVGAAATEAEARSLLAALGPSLGGRETRVETAVVAGRTWRRAVVAGFADATEAAGFCAGLKSAGRDCFVRKAAR